ncbi:MAG: hypothetical protein B6D37_05040 [Sphingobacteriales bacterium UTBCD1]|jgi:hypothetical protein|nr:MAG: hypothetical protein B6D37_05040 [Sphingobacteriales bacterium UTBCD1]
MQLKLIPFLLFLTVKCIAQDLPCTYFPAPCPNETDLSRANDWTDRMKDNIALEQELKFEKKMSQETNRILQSMAKLNNWQLYEVSESAYDGPPFIFISYDDWEKTPYEKRPPRSYNITYLIVVNNDSLIAWRNWFADFKIKMQNGADDYINQMKSVDQNPLLKTYSDSANYYAQQMANYIQNHQQQYMQDLQADNKKGIQNYESGLKKIQNKQDLYIKKSNDLQEKLSADPGQSIKNLQTEQANQIAAFAGSSLVLVRFLINPYIVKSGLEDGDQHSLLPQYSFKVPGASYAGLLINKTLPDLNSYKLNSDEVFNNPASIATIMFGSFQPKDGYNNYRPSFEKSFNNKIAVIGSARQLKCDVLQNLAVQLEGRPDKINAVISKINWSEINSMIGK